MREEKKEMEKEKLRGEEICKINTQLKTNKSRFKKFSKVKWLCVSGNYLLDTSFTKTLT